MKKIITTVSIVFCLSIFFPTLHAQDDVASLVEGHYNGKVRYWEGLGNPTSFLGDTFMKIKKIGNTGFMVTITDNYNNSFYAAVRKIDNSTVAVAIPNQWTSYGTYDGVYLGEVMNISDGENIHGYINLNTGQFIYGVLVDESPVSFEGSRSY